STRMPVHRLNRQRTKDFFSIAARDTQSFENVSTSLFRCEGKRLGPERDALAKLPEFSLVQFLFYLRLPGKHDLEQFLGRSLQVRQQPNFFQRLPRENLRLIHNQNGLLTGLVAVE